MIANHYIVGDIRIEPNIVLSPMEGVTDLTFRRLIRQIGGAGLTVTEFVASKGLSQGDKKQKEMAEFDPDEHPVAVQIFGRDPYQMGEAAKIVEGMGADICDINMGCPSKRVCANSGGSALMREPDLAREIVQSVVAAVNIPVTVKMRSGFDASQRNAPEIAYMCQEEGAQAIAIHWRTRADLYKGERQVDKIKETKERLHIPVLGNGDIVDIESAKAMFEETGVDGLLIGRGAIQNPWVLLQVSQWIRGEEPVTVDALERRRVMFSYFHAIQARFQSEIGALGRFKMLANSFSRGLPEGKCFRKNLVLSQSCQELMDRADAYFDRLKRFEGGDETAFNEYEAPVFERAGKSAA